MKINLINFCKRYLIKHSSKQAKEMFNFLETEIKQFDSDNEIESYKDDIKFLLASLDHTSGEKYIILNLLEKIFYNQNLTPLENNPDSWIYDAPYKFNGSEYKHIRQPLLVLRQIVDLHNNQYNYFIYKSAILWQVVTQDETGIHPSGAFFGEVEGYKSEQQIRSFPFVPRTFTIDVKMVDKKGDQQFTIIDENQLKAANEYYNILKDN